jgi:hypothetical protein
MTIKNNYIRNSTLKKMKALKFILFALACTALCKKNAAQTHSIGVKSGITYTKINSDQSNGSFVDLKYLSGLSCGLSYEYLFDATRYFLGTGLAYNQRGFIGRSGIDIDFAGSENPLFTWRFDYISMPITGGHYWGNTQYIFFNIGIIHSIFVFSKQTVPAHYEMWEHKEENTYTATDGVGRFDFAGELELGGGYKLANRYWLSLALAYQRSFTSIATSRKAPYSHVRHNGFTLNLSLKYNLTTK